MKIENSLKLENSKMTRPEASEKIKASCKIIALEMMKLNPTIASLDDTETQEALYEASYALTKQLEIIKKKVIQLERRDGSTEV